MTSITNSADDPWYMHPSINETKLLQAPDDQTRSLAASLLRNGYVVIPDSIPAETCDAAVDRFRCCEKRNARMFKPHLDEQGHYPRIVNLHLVIPELRRLFTENIRALALQDFLFSAETVVYSSLFFERGTEQAMHRDTPLVCTRPEYRYFSMWVALEDVDDDNGALMVMEGGHRIPELDDREAIAAELFGTAERAPPISKPLWYAYQDRIVAAGNKLGLPIKTVPVKKGSTIVCHPQLPHGGSPIRDLTRTRFSALMHMTPLGTPVYHQDAFHNPHKFYPTVASWSYSRDGNRRYAKFSTVSFNIHGRGADCTKDWALDEFESWRVARRSLRMIRRAARKLSAPRFC